MTEFELEIRQQTPPLISFYNANNQEILGELKEIDGKLEFEGDVSESAKVFFDEYGVHHSRKIKELEQEINFLKQQLKSNVAYAENN